MGFFSCKIKFVFVFVENKLIVLFVKTLKTVFLSCAAFSTFVVLMWLGGALLIYKIIYIPWVHDFLGRSLYCYFLPELLISKEYSINGEYLVTTFQGEEASKNEES